MTLRLPDFSSPAAPKPSARVRAMDGWRWLEPIWIGLLAPSVLFPGRFWVREWHPVLVVLLFVFWPLHPLWGRGRGECTPLRLPVLLMALWLPVSILLALDPLTAWESGGYVALGLALYVALSRWPPLVGQPQRVAWLYLALCGGLAVVGPFLLGIIPMKFPWLPTHGGLLGTWAAGVGETVNPNVLAGGVAPAVPLALALALFPGQAAVSRMLTGLLALLLAGVILLSQSRGAYAATAIGCLLVLVLRGRRAALTSLSIVAVSGIVLWTNQAVWTPIGAALTQGGLERRMQIWERAACTLRDFPLTGLGFGHFAVLVPVLYPYFVAFSEPPHAHNLYLQIGVDMGLPGLAASGALWLGITRGLVQALARFASPTRRAVAVGTLAALVVVWTHGLVDAAAWSSKLAFLPWLLYAAAASLVLEHVPRVELNTSTTVSSLR